MQSGTERVARVMAATAAVLAGVVTGQEPQACDSIAAEIATRLDLLTDEKIFADLPEALREAELQALQISLAIYEAGLVKGQASAGRDFHEAAVAFSASELAATKALRETMGGARRRRREPAEVASQPQPLAASRRIAEEGLLVDLDLAIGVLPLPDRFLGLFLDARRESTAWFDAFSLYIAWHIRSDVGLQQALAAEPLASLAAVELTMSELMERLFVQAKQTALRIEARLAEAEALNSRVAETDNGEISAFLADLPGEVAKRMHVSRAALERSAQALRAESIDPGRLEDALVRQAQRLKSLLEELTSAKSLPASASLTIVDLLHKGDIKAAATTLRALPETAHRARAEACCAALLAEWTEARLHGNRAIELVHSTEARLASSAALDLAGILAQSADVEVSTMAVDLYEAVLTVGPTHLSLMQLVDASLGAARTALALRKGPRQLKALTGSIASLDVLLADRSRGLAPDVIARLLLARGEVLVALVGQGADRLDEAETAFKDALPVASAARDVLLTSQLHARIADIASLRARGATTDEAQVFRGTALAALQAAQVARLRARDPLWWAEIKIRTAEMLLLIAGGRGDEAGIKAGIISAKSALRLLSMDVSRERRIRGLTALGGLFAALAKIQPGRRRHDQALAAFEVALAAANPVSMPAAWTNLLIRIGTQLMPSSEEVDAPRIADVISRYRAGIATMDKHQPSVHRLQRVLAEALVADGKRRLAAASLSEAAALLRSVLVTLTPDVDATNWGQTQILLADALREMARLTHDASALDEAVKRLNEVEVHAEKAQRLNVLSSARRRLVACRSLARVMEPKQSHADPARQVRQLLQKSG